jgi:hypothetical protein
METGTCIRAFPTNRPKMTVPKQVAFAEDSKVVVGGSDHGVLYVFDRRSGSRLDVLRHASEGLVQTITVMRPLYTPIWP